MPTDLVVFVALVVILAVAGIVLGMLVAPRLTRFAEREDRSDRDDRTD